MSEVPDCSPSSELFEEVLLCARYGESDDLKEYFSKLPQGSVEQLISQQDSRGNTALHFCSANGHLEIVKLLLSIKTSAIDLKNEGGNTALHWACLNGHLETVKFLVDAGADVKLRNKGGRIPIDEAESQNKESIVLWLLALDMKREKEAGVAENGMDEEGDEGDVSVNVPAGETVETVKEPGSSKPEQVIDEVDMLD